MKLYDVTFDIKKEPYSGSYVMRNVKAENADEARNACVVTVGEKCACHAFHTKAAKPGTVEKRPGMKEWDTAKLP